MDSHDEESPLVADSSPVQTPKQNHARDVHILSSAFLLIFLAYGAAQNLESTLNTEEDLGTTSLGILYLSFTFFSLVASVVVRRLGTKNALVLGTTGYWLFIAANLKPTWYTMVPASVYLGFSASIIWVGQGTYLTSTARSHAKDCNLHEGTVIGNFNGEFWGMFASNQFVGNLISLAMLSDGTEGSTSGTTLLFVVFLCSMTLGTILMCFLTKRNHNAEDGTQDSSVGVYSTVVSLSKSLVTLLFDARMLLTIPLIAYSGLQQAFVWAEFTKDIVTPALGVSGVGGAMAVYGAFDAICSLAAGRLTSGLTSITLIVSGGALIQAVVFLWLLLIYRLTSGVLGIMYPLLMAAMLGIGDGVFNTQLNALLGILFKHDTEGAFAQLKVWQSGSIAVVFFVSPYISLKAMLVVMLAALCLSYAGFLLLTLKKKKNYKHKCLVPFCSITEVVHRLVEVEVINNTLLL
ncbi:UNC93-like protein 3 isoform X2 [Corylus avellana]|uniref:UNC93-like protein 3 isoform X2 n=1 Tax=Corylus avellana TaxID=13451 RepID=UPI00286A58BD|nr:UNC93-like protein 3 isoform X2 [Corylus avellana]